MLRCRAIEFIRGKKIQSSAKGFATFSGDCFNYFLYYISSSLPSVAWKLYYF